MDAAVIAAYIAAGAAILASILSAVISYRSGKATRDAVTKQRSEDHRVRQLNELYGPMHILRKESRRLWKQLPPDPDPEPGVTEWRLIDHIEEIKSESDGRRRKVVDRILDINEQLREFIVGRAGLLLSFPAPDTFETFLIHSTTLAQHWDRGVNVTDPNSYVPFPGEIDSDIDSAIESLRAGLDSG